MLVLNRPGFAAIVASLSGYSPTATEWSLDPNAFVGDLDRAKIQLEVFGIEAVGVDEHRIAFNPAGYPAGALVTTEIGNREITINIYAEVYDAGAEAAEVIDAIRTGIRADAVTAQLNAINLALIWMTKTTRLRAVRNERALNAAAADIRLGGIAQLVSNVQINSGWVDQIDSTPLTKAVIPGTFTQ
jgi:hypothetical protein